jgi:hypothetical protein
MIDAADVGSPLETIVDAAFAALCRKPEDRNPPLGALDGPVPGLVNIGRRALNSALSVGEFWIAVAWSDVARVE